MERCLQSDQLTIVVAHSYRLAWFEFDLIEWLVERNGGKIVVFSKTAHTSPSDELVSGLLAILSIVAARMPSLDKYRDEIKED